MISTQIRSGVPIPVVSTKIVFTDKVIIDF